MSVLEDDRRVTVANLEAGEFAAMFATDALKKVLLGCLNSTWMHL